MTALGRVKPSSRAALIAFGLAMLGCAPGTRPAYRFTSPEDVAAASEAPELRSPADLPTMPTRQPPARAASVATAQGGAARGGACYQWLTDSWWEPSQEIAVSTNQRFYGELAGEVLAAVGDEIPRRGVAAEVMYCAGVDHVVEILRSQRTELRGCAQIERGIRDLLATYQPQVRRCEARLATHYPDPGERRAQLATAEPRIVAVLNEAWNQENLRAIAASSTMMMMQQQAAQAREADRDAIRDGNRRAQHAAEARASADGTPARWIRQSVTSPSLWTTESATPP
jgi:hypothetical protein